MATVTMSDFIKKLQEEYKSLVHELSPIEFIATHYGYSSQSRQLIEEMAELMVAINKYDRADKSDVITARECLNIEHLQENIYEEIADVEIMVEQIKYLLRCNEEVDQIKERKIKRQLDRISRENER